MGFLKNSCEESPVRMVEVIMVVIAAVIMAGETVTPQIQPPTNSATGGPPCPKCGSATNPGGRYCAQCGTALVPSNCVDCNANLSPGTKFCPNCCKAHSHCTVPGRFIRLIVCNVSCHFVNDL